MNWLKEFPSTNALCLSGILLAWATFIASLAHWKIPDGWLLFVIGIATAGAAQFTAKRITERPPDL